MSTVRGLARLFIARSTRLLAGRNVANSSPVSCRSRSIFAATTRGASQKPRILPVSCACSQVCVCQMHKHTQADSDIIKFLKGEIQSERDAAPKVPISDLFKAEVNGTQVKLEREHNAERIVVSFDINENTNNDEASFSGSDDEGEVAGKIVSYPLFTVEIIKKAGKTLQFYCEFNTQLEDEHSGEDEGPHLFYIVNIAVSDGTNKGKTFYCAETENMDEDLYGMLLKMLAERGIDNHFAAWLRDYSTAMEQQHYIKFLEDLQGFVKLQ
ncbi:Complement component 1 Q subcomponent-binding protein, mitochondrial [Stylophora pistillata]|uniref:Complement component 1 Q subcomponent-binding protein, mitochondrial n=2 Tax=Stylophora pistillata TaxID=50429 RepID=A0A2B4SHA8_STYPI|nr:Complement component 1 Q subcomponent-binding protein, mitochondrial [Stylophora pistillata]